MGVEWCVTLLHGQGRVEGGAHPFQGQLIGIIELQHQLHRIGVFQQVVACAGAAQRVGPSVIAKVKQLPTF
jgi:hypothetical protein